MVIRKFIAELLPIILGVAFFILFIAFLQCQAVPAATAQATMATLSGLVTEETGAVVADVQITAMNTDTGLQRQTATNEAGYFILPLLPPGNYTLTAVLPGFATVTINDITLQVSLNSSIQIILKPKAISEAIEVKADGAIAAGGSQVDITNATAKYTIGNKQVISLPVFTSDLGRNALSVLPFLIPGVSPTTVFGSGRSDTNRFGQQMSINGGRPTSISFYLEDGDNNDEGIGQAASPLPNPDALREFTVITSNYQADLGRSSGGILNAVIKSGTRQYAGNARYYIVNEALNARGFFDPRVPLDRLNTFGGQFGGPVRVPHLFDGRKRVFFFFDYEGTRSGRESLSTLSLPSSKERQGDFRDSLSLPLDPLTRRRFPNGVIPSTRIVPIARAYLEKYVPVPNNGERDFSRLLLTQFQTSQMTTRWDANIGTADTLSASFFSTASTIRADQPTLPIGSLTRTQSKNQNLVLRETHSFSPRSINQFTLALTRLVSDTANIAPAASGVSPADFGFTGVHPQNGEFLGVPSVSITGTDVRIVTGGGARRARTGWQIKDDLSQAYGPYALKFGGELRGLVENSLIGSNNGSFTFLGNGSKPLSTGNSIADFLLGLPFIYNQTTDNARYPRWRALYLYGMGDLRVRPNLTVNLGLRYELVPPLIDKLDQVSAFRPGQTSDRFPNAPVGLLFVGDTDPVLGTLPRGLYPTGKTNFAPRLGIAYSPEPDSGWLRHLFGKGETALRAGGGLFFDQAFGAGFSRVSSTQPFAVSQTFSLAGGNFANPFGESPNPWPVDRDKGNFIGIPNLEPIDPEFRNAYTYQYNLTLQRQLPGAFLLEAAYIGSKSFHLARQREINDALITPQATMANLQARRRYPYLGSIRQQESSGHARYDSFQLGVKRQFGSGLIINGSYVFGKSLDDGSNPLFSPVSNPFRWARSDYDRTHSFVVSYSYDLPAPKLGGFIGGLLGDWQMNGITEFRSGLPMDIAQSFDSTLTGRSALGTVDIVEPYTPFDPHKPQTIIVAGSPQTGNYFFDPTAFKALTFNLPSGVRPAELGRNLFDGPGMKLWSLSLLKRVRMESHQIIFRTDIRNLFNQANFAMPSLLANDIFTFGKVSLAAPGRNVQLSLKYVF